MIPSPHIASCQPAKHPPVKQQIDQKNIQFKFDCKIRLCTEQHRAITLLHCMVPISFRLGMIPGKLGNLEGNSVLEETFSQF